MSKFCPRCQTKKDESDFYINKGKAKYGGFSSWCRVCSQNARKLRHDKDMRENPEKIRRKNADYNLSHPKNRWVYQTLSSHRKMGHKIELTAKELLALVENSPRCLFCDVVFNWKKKNAIGGKRDNWPSLDRINNETTLRVDNVMIICCPCNVTKGKKTLQEFIDYCTKVSELSSQ